MVEDDVFFTGRWSLVLDTHMQVCSSLITMSANGRQVYSDIEGGLKKAMACRASGFPCLLPRQVYLRISYLQLARFSRSLARDLVFGLDVGQLDLATRVRVGGATVVAQ